jgi:uncharacterized LabA/DUF88 family protein
MGTAQCASKYRATPIAWYDGIMKDGTQDSKPTDRPPRVFAFIDSQNLNLGVQKFGWKLNWQKFRKFLAEKYGVTRAFMFIGYIPENEDLYEQMHEAGFAVVLKPTFDLTKPRIEPTQPETDNKSADDEEKKPVKGNVDAELVLWTMKELSNYDKAIIVSGDGDFYSLVEYLEGKKRLLHLLTPSGQYSSLYNKYEQYVVRLDRFRKELAYFPHHGHGYKNHQKLGR